MNEILLTLSAVYREDFLRCNDKNIVEFIGKECDIDLLSFVRTSDCIPYETSAYYFEVEILNGGEDDFIVVGISDDKADRCPGMNPNTIGIYGFDGSICVDAEEIAIGSNFTTGDTVSCLISRQKDGAFIKTVCQFFKNGTKIGPPRSLVGKKQYPSVGLCSPGASVKFNLGGQPFSHDIGKVVTI